MMIPFTKGIPDSVVRVEPRLALTPEGKQKIERFEGSGPGFSFMAYLLENGACSLSALSRGLNIDRDKVKMVGRALMREGLVRRVD